ncbi:hypothetical protein MTR_6g075150 [Medicago truncatula]|uniref:Uncharacterized protein n=1 Tax=Medicago truncatula TaxID=3880 RepID=A0A072UAJ5_MEDTR|nr:hypothetical protein MTR_6g075150 [Medicago truncatula]
MPIGFARTHPLAFSRRVDIVSAVHRLRHKENASSTTCAKYREGWIKIKEPVCAKIIINSKMHSFNFYEMLQKLDRTQSLQLCIRC